MVLLSDRFHFLQPSSRFWRVLALLVLFAGILLRMAIWWQQRPIFIDEANLIRNYAERSYAGLFQNLDYEQYAPPFFSVMVKASIDLFGNNELSTRLFPLLCSLATLGLFYRFGKRFLNMPAFVAALAFVAFGKIFIDYATESKQYATDGFIALLLLELTYRIPRPQSVGWRSLAWGAIGAAAVWFSMPSVFVLAGIGSLWLYRGIRARSSGAIWGAVLVGALWVASFGLYFVLLLLHNTQSSYLQGFHNRYFLAFPPRNFEELQLLLRQLEHIANKAIGKTAIAMIVAASGWIAAVRQMIICRHETRWQMAFWLLLLPILFCFTASVLRYYSLLARLTLFFLPLFILMVFMGLESLAKNRIAAAIISVLVLIVLGNQQQLTKLNEPFHSDYAEVRDGMKLISEQQRPGEVIIATDAVLPVVRYYTQHHQSPIPLQNVYMQKIGSGHMLEGKLDSLHRQGVQHVWVVADIHDKAYEELTARPDRVLKQEDYYYSSIFLYNIQ